MPKIRILDILIVLGILLGLVGYLVIDSAIYTMPLVLEDGEKLGDVQCLLPDLDYDLGTVGNCEEYCEENLAGRVKKSTLVDGEVYNVVCERTLAQAPPPTTTPPPQTLPPTTPPKTKPPTTAPPTTAPPAKPKMILDPLPPGYSDKDEISDAEYNEQRFPSSGQEAYSIGVVGKYG
ncbi:MAG: hypothetical protein V3V92_00235, partial [Candidatus Hydrothermarchaeales archaeon]